TNSGASATLGTLLKPMMRGYKKRSKTLEPTSATAISTPPTTASAKPASVVHKVYKLCIPYQDSSAHSSAKMLVGKGSIMGRTSNTRHTTSQITSTTIRENVPAAAVPN